MTTATATRHATIRYAGPSDVDGLITMARHFIASTEYGAHIPDDEAHCRQVIEQLLSVGVVVVAERDGALIGMLGGMVYPHFVTARITATEAFWWVEPHMRGARVAKDLLEAFAAWAIERGAAVIELGSRHEKLDRFYERLGYRAVERVFQKEV